MADYLRKWIERDLSNLLLFLISIPFTPRILCGFLDGDFVNRTSIDAYQGAFLGSLISKLRVAFLAIDLREHTSWAGDR